MTDSPDLWASFTHDPRQSDNAPLRAADADREVVRQLLVEAYADGRLDREELDARTAALGEARTLGDLPGLLDGLVAPSAVPAVRPSGTLTPDQIHQRAVERWETERRQAFGSFLLPNLICWVIWAATMFGGFPWPVFVTIGTGFHLFNVSLHKREIIAREARAIEKKQRKDLEG